MCYLLVGAIEVRHPRRRQHGEHGAHVVADLFDLVRAAMLRTSIERMLGSRVLAAAGEGIVDEFMSFQDAVPTVASTGPR